MPDIRNLGPHVPDRIVLPSLGRPIADHELLQRLVEARAAIGRLASKVRVLCGEPSEELVLDLDEEAEGDPAAEGLGRDHEICEAAGGGVRVLAGRSGDVVDVVLPMGVRELLRRLVVDLGEDEGGEGRGLRGGAGRVFGQDGAVMRDAGALATLVTGGDLDRSRGVILEKRRLRG